MKLPLRTLGGQVAALLVAALVAAYGLGLWSAMSERVQVLGSMMLPHLGRDVASSLAMLERLPPSERNTWLEPLARPSYHFSLQPVPPGPEAGTAFGRRLVEALSQSLGAGRVGATRVDGEGRHQVGLRLADGTPITLYVQPPGMRVSAATVWRLLLQIALLAGVVALAVRLATRPVRQLSDAAQRLGQDPDAPPLPLRGPQEVQRAAAAFNAMQRRLAEHMAERLQILAAVSHDLQTPITRMRVRTELLADEPARDKLQADLAEMQRLVEEGLAYARSAHAANEPVQRVDLHALLDSLVCDRQDAGHAVELQAPEGVVLSTRPQALQRVVGNLVDNAIKFAGQAEVVAEVLGDDVTLTVQDRGPGIPEHRLAQVMLPFERLETSRNPETGGSGLGLAIAQRLAAVLGAQLQLRNRPDGGLAAVLRVPSHGPGPVAARRAADAE
ncbi:ATP-binding protein [Caldimonas brevitalea]|uniref:histidine kinase n=1 Tax=Caldimonas brevitalea TaxID=413882 RepID=A0A0G3BR01_9BURK|nr:ATP-binding protein [Caldimonas brevitalea]AKJ31852.1 sensor histidine kinase [Caldimonas brevitalea]